MIKYIVISTLSLLLLTRCNSNKSEETPINFGSETYDSTALHVALVPNRECLPIYYAQQQGIFKRLGLNLQIATYSSALECDTAILNKHADGGIMDRERYYSYGSRTQNLDIAWKANAPLQIFACHALRIKSIKNLEGRTVGIARQSIDEIVLKQVLKQANIDEGNIYLPQINNMKLRTEMLSTNQIDAAVLTWPYSTLAQTHNHNLLYTYKDSTDYIYFVQNKTNPQKPQTKEQWKLFEQGRKMAIDSLKVFGNQAYSNILQQQYGLSKELADSITY